MAQERVAVPLNEILVGDAVEQLRRIPSDSVHTVVTSPPYWGLRDYGVAGQIGLEATPEAFVARLVEVFREVRRVLRPDGTLWLNMGDCYATGAGAVGDCPGGGEQGARWRGDVDRPRDEKRRSTRDGSHAGKHTAMAAMGPMNQPNRMPIPGLKPKDLVGQPWRLAFALQADGWWLRCDCIWAKRNPMPESVQDRPTKSHEYVFLLSKSAHYFYDAEAVKEPQEEHERTFRLRQMERGVTDRKYQIARDALDLQPPQGRTGVARSLEARHRLALRGTRNLRSVWSIATQPFPEAHFATFPEDLAARCILAGTSERGCCATCGAPMEREIEIEYDNPGNRSTNGARSVERAHEEFGSAGFEVRLERRSTTKGWRRTCRCKTKLAAVPAVVLDPFMGAGTTALVALKSGRRFIGVELNPAYAELARRRIEPELVQGRLA